MKFDIQCSMELNVGTINHKTSIVVSCSAEHSLSGNASYSLPNRVKR